MVVFYTFEGKLEGKPPSLFAPSKYIRTVWVLRQLDIKIPPIVGMTNAKSVILS